MFRTKRIMTMTVVSTAIILSACGRGSDSKPTTQVAAKVNGDEITVHQINSALSRGGAMAPEQLKKAAPQILERIIDQQLLVQKAVEAKLDRDPAVVQAIEASRRQILSQAYIEKTMTAALKSSTDEIRKFYDQNPALFHERRVYRFQEVTVTAPVDKVTALRAEARKAKTMYDVADWLKSQNLPYDIVSTTKTAEQLPMELLPQLAQMKDGQIAVIPGPSGAAVIQLVQSQQAPFNEHQAMPVIEAFLMNRKRLELAEAEVKKLRGAAKIEYVGDFAVAKPGGSAPAKAVSAPATVLAPTPAPAPDAAAKGDSVIDKGLSGLK